MRVLVVGHRSMLAQELLLSLQQAGFTVSGSGRPELDLTYAASIANLLVKQQPQLCINTAAYTAVDRAETEPAIAFAVNRDGVAHLAEACQRRGIPLVHVSTDYVFDGTASFPYCEAAPAAPLGIYGRSKWEGEQAIRAQHGEHLIVRTAWLYGHHGTNFVKTMLRLGRAQRVLRVVDDQHGCPTWTRDLAQALTTICQRLTARPDASLWGTYHFCGAGQTTWHEFAQAIFMEGRSSQPLLVEHVEAISTTAYPTPARRPAYSVLDCAKIRTVFGITPRFWRDSLHGCMQEWPP